MHISTMWHSFNVLKYFCPLSVYIYIQGRSSQILIGQVETLLTVLIVAKLVRLYHTYNINYTKVGQVET